MRLVLNKEIGKISKNNKMSWTTIRTTRVELIRGQNCILGSKPNLILKC